MERDPNKVIETARAINRVLDQETILIYREKLSTALDSSDSDYLITTLLDLSNKSNIIIDLIYDLLENFEKNKNLTFIFINELIK